MGSVLKCSPDYIGIPGATSHPERVCPNKSRKISNMSFQASEACPECSRMALASESRNLTKINALRRSFDFVPISRKIGTALRMTGFGGFKSNTEGCLSWQTFETRLLGV